jgi:ABC-type polysaccharide/polyol phosphate export permease
MAGSHGVLVGEAAWQIQRRVIGALILREMITRYGRNNIGFLWLFIEPALFTLVVTAFWSATRSVHASSIQIEAFALTGYSAVQLWRNLPSRCTGAIKSNMALLHHRQVTVLDIYAARLVLEIMAATMAFVFLSISFGLLDIVEWPADTMKVLGGWLLLAWFGIGLALTIAGLSERMPVVGRLWPPFSYVLFPLSGVAFLVDALPTRLQEIVLWLPMLSAMEFLREGWFGMSIRAHYDIPYVIVFDLGLTLIGLSMVRQVGLDASEE